MADYAVANYADVESVGGGLHFLRDALGCENLGISVIDADPGWEGKPHDHAESDHEEVYLLVEGTATVHVGDDTVTMTRGDAIRVAPDTERQVVAGDEGALLVVAGAP
jgi:quercetin dioxygenase-like cupin family protein